MNINIIQVEDIIKYWGDKMPMLVMEESGELIQAISKRERANTVDKKEIADKGLIDEIGDMYISLLAIRLYYGIDLFKIEDRIKEKLNKKY